MPTQAAAAAVHGDTDAVATATATATSTEPLRDISHASHDSVDHEDDALSLEHIFRSLAQHSRVFALRSADVSLLASPTAFYERLLHNIRSARRRITISSLYLGTGELEQALVATILAKLRENTDVRVTIVLDHSRGQRGGQRDSSVSLLAPLLEEFPDRMEVYLYKVPQLRGLKASLPPPFNETMGVSHAKVYLVDDTLILSGANLSHDYFTNRQDRYVEMAHSGGLAAFYHQFVRVVAAYSYRAQLETAPRTNDQELQYELVPPTRPSESKKAAMKREFDELVACQDHDEAQAQGQTLGSSQEGDADTWAFPTLQFSPVEVTHDERVLTALLQRLPPQSSLGIASGYLNFPPFLDELLVCCAAHVEVVTAAPMANGFFTASGIKGALPMAYSLIEQEFYDKTRARPYETTIREFNRPGWTFHGKGMWLRANRDTNPALTIVGSSNFGRRSYGCDLEAQLVLFTKSAALREQLHHEFVALAHEHAERVTDQVWRRPDRSLHGLLSWQYGHWIRPVSKMIAAYL